MTSNMYMDAKLSIDLKPIAIWVTQSSVNLGVGAAKVIIEKSRGGVSPMGQDTIENVS